MLKKIRVKKPSRKHLSIVSSLVLTATLLLTSNLSLIPSRVNSADVNVAPTVSTFTETFDGDPASPTPWNPDNWDVTVHSRDIKTWDTLPAMNADHGTGCEAPDATHIVENYDDVVYNCKNHMMTAINGPGYALAYLTPNHMVDFSEGTATIRWDMSTERESMRDWTDVWITPYDSHLQLPLLEWLPDLNGTPETAVHVEMMDLYNSFTVGDIRNFSDNRMRGSEYWNGYDTILTPSARERQTFEIVINPTHIKVWMPELGFVFVDRDFETPLEFNQGIVQFGHHSYNPGKACFNGPDGSCGANTWHWDNVEIAPSLPFTIIKTDKREAKNPQGETLTLNTPAPANSYLRFAAFGNNIEIRPNGGTWTPAHEQQGGKAATDVFHSYFTSLPEGTTSVEVRGTNVYGNEGYRVRDITVWSKTATSVGGPEAEPSPSPTPAPVGGFLNPAPPAPTAEQIAAGIPLCPTHDPNQWHALYDPVRNCHYDHHHFDDPSRVDDIFGPVGAAYDLVDGVADGQAPSISYPWQTWKGADLINGAPTRAEALASNTMENDLKHEGYRWIVRRVSDYAPGAECSSGTTTTTCLTDFRAQSHSTFAGPTGLVRYHSGWIEARICQNSPEGTCGIVRTGGWVDYGILVLMQEAGTPDEQYPLPEKDPTQPSGARRIHPSTDTPFFGPKDTTWYDGNSHLELSLRGAALGPFDLNDPTNLLITNVNTQQIDDSGHRFNTATSSLNDWMEAHVISVPGLTYYWQGLDGSNLDEDGTQNGFITFSGYTDQFGEINEDCTAPLGVTCVPLSLENVPIGLNQYRETARLGGIVTENGVVPNYDTSPDGEFWLTWFEPGVGGTSPSPTPTNTPNVTPIETATPTPGTPSTSVTTVLPAGTTNATISLTTDINAICKYDDADTFFSLMNNTFTETGGTLHTTVVTGLEDGGIYTYYIKCKDDSLLGIPSTDIVTFIVEAVDSGTGGPDPTLTPEPTEAPEPTATPEPTVEPTATSTPSPTPTLEVPSDDTSYLYTLPARIQAEDFMNGGEGTAYHDRDSRNRGESDYRAGEGVDLGIAEDTDSTPYVGWIRRGEWLSFDIDVPESGLYDIKPRIAGRYKRWKTISLTLDEYTESALNLGRYKFRTTGGWQRWESALINNIYLPEGRHTLTVKFDSSSFNLNYIDIVPAGL